MPDQYGNPTFKDIFDNPEVFRQLYNAYAPATSYSIGGAPSQPATFQSQPVQKVPVPNTQPTMWDALRNAFQVAAANSTDAARIYQRAPVEGLGNRAIEQQQAAQMDREQAAQRAQMFNAQQENQFGRIAQQQAFAATQNDARLAAVNQRAEDRLQSAKDLNDARIQAAKDLADLNAKHRDELEDLKAKHDKEIADLKAKKPNNQIVQTDTGFVSIDKDNPTAPPVPIPGVSPGRQLQPKQTESAKQNITQLEQMPQVIKDAEDAFYANAHIAPGQTQTFGQSVRQTMDAGLGRLGETSNLIQSVTSRIAPTSEGIKSLDALSAIRDKQLLGIGRFAMELYHRMRGIVPGGAENPVTAADKFKKLKQMFARAMQIRERYGDNVDTVSLSQLQAELDGRKPPGTANDTTPPAKGQGSKNVDDTLDQIFK